MKAVSIRELKNGLTEYIREVRRGERILVTDRGEVVAELAPPNDAHVYPSLRPALKPGRTAALLAEERGR